MPETAVFSSVISSSEVAYCKSLLCLKNVSVNCFTAFSERLSDASNTDLTPIVFTLSV